jgi:hypothetical protein
MDQDSSLVQNLSLKFVFRALSLKLATYPEGVGHIRPTPYGFWLKLKIIYVRTTSNWYFSQFPNFHANKHNCRRRRMCVKAKISNSVRPEHVEQCLTGGG